MSDIAPFTPLAQTYPLYLANEPVKANSDLPVFDKYSGEKVTHVALASEEQIEQAFETAEKARPAMEAMAAHERRAVLDHCVMRFGERAEELAQIICIEVGKTIREARMEVTRLIDTFAIAAEESVRLVGQITPLDRSARTDGYTAYSRPVPVGVCSFISPFNFPLNLSAHKIAPALAVGCPFVLKPASKTPVSSLILGEILAETDLPKGAFSILPCSREGARLFAEHPVIKHLSFTGSPAAGWPLKGKAGKASVTMELGGNAAVIVDEGVDIEDTVARIVLGTFYQAGQSCISVQRIFVHDSVYERFKERLVTAASKLVMGDPKLETTDLGPMISEPAAQKMEQWIEQAKAGGARPLLSGPRQGALMPPTILENVPEDLPLVCQEAFGPVAVLFRFTDFETALERVNDSEFGLQAGVFTNDLRKAHLAWETLEVGGVIINDIPSWRADQMPYGGVKDSGLGREGVRYAMEAMTETRLMVVRDRPL